MKDKIRNMDLYWKMIYSFLGLIVFFLLVQNSGGLRMVSNKIETLGRVLAGYEERIYCVKNDITSVIPILKGSEYVQEVYFSKEMLANEQLMFQIRVGAYDRINEGKVYVQIEQDTQCKVYELEMNTVKGNETLILLFETSGFEEGNVQVKMYTPHATGMNCIALYVVDNKDVYAGLEINGESTEKNMCLNVFVPSVFVKNDFKEVGLEYCYQGYIYEQDWILEGSREYEIYLPESSADQIYQITLLLSSSDTINTGKLEISFTQGRSVVTQEIDIASIQSGQYMQFLLDGKHYNSGACKIEMHVSETTEANSVAVGVTKMTEHTDEEGNTPTYLTTDIFLIEKME